MMDQALADKCLALIKKNYSDLFTLRDAISEMYESSYEDECIEHCITEDIPEVIDRWANDNHTSSDEIINFIMKNLDEKADFDLEINRNYGPEWVSLGGKCKAYPNGLKGFEITYNVSFTVKGLIFDCQESYYTADEIELAEV